MADLTNIKENKKVKDLARKEYLKHKEIYRDKGWYRSRFMRNAIYTLMGFAIFIIGMLLSTNHFISSSIEYNSSTIVIGVLLAIFGFLLMSIKALYLYLMKVTYSLYSVESDQDIVDKNFGKKDLNSDNK